MVLFFLSLNFRNFSSRLSSTCWYIFKLFDDQNLSSTILYLNGKFYSIMSAPAWLPHNFSSAIAPKGLPNNGGEYFLKETSYFLTCFFKISISQLFVPIGTLIIECILDLIGTSITNKYFVLKIVLTCPCWNKLSEQFSNKIKKYHFLHLPFNNKYEN